ncbi:P-selectin glycoprotein ligand 1 [Spinachia spinachia]
MMPLSMKTFLALLWGVSVSNVVTSDTSVNSTAEPHTPAGVGAASPAGTNVQPEQVVATSPAGAARRSLNAMTDPAPASVAGVPMSSQQPSSTAKLFKQTVGNPSASATPPVATSRTTGASVFDPTKSETFNTSRQLLPTSKLVSVTKTSTARSSTISFTTESPTSTAKVSISTIANVSATANVPAITTISTTTTANVPNIVNVSTTANVPNIANVTTTANVPNIVNVSTTPNVSTSPTGILFPRVPKKMSIPTTKSPPVATVAPGVVSKNPPTIEAPPCSTQRVIKPFLIVIAILALLATVFIFSTIVLCSKLSSRKYNLGKPQPATEMMCISALLPERNVAYSRHRNPVTNGVLVIHGHEDSDDDGGDNLTLSSFLPENDRYV